MKKILFSLLLFAVLLASTTYVLASTGEKFLKENKNKFILPKKNFENTNSTFFSGKNVIPLGKAIDREGGEMVEGYAIIKYKDKPAKPSGTVKPAKPTKTPVCYGYLGSGVKWKNLENWVINPAQRNASSTYMLDDEFIYNTISNGIAKWENAAQYNIIGGGIKTSDVLGADTVSPDGLNEVYFADIDEPDVIGVTIIWGIFGGAPKNRKIVEWDQVYDDTDFMWGNDGNPYMMDFESIATHELGHTVGMGDLYTSDCIDETMYGYAGEGEINKRDLGPGDTKGISLLY